MLPVSAARVVSCALPRARRTSYPVTEPASSAGAVQLNATSPSLAASALFHIIGNTVFLRLADVASGLPDYDEQILLSSMDSEEDATGYSQRSAYTTVYEELRKKLAEALKAGSKRLLATYLQTLLAYPEGCTKGETVFDPRSGDVIVQVPPLSEDKLYPKEKALVDLVAAERMEGRRVLVYATHTGTRDITGRMDDILTRHGFRVAVMKADAVAPDKREAWVADRVKQGIDVMICHPRLVQTGLDLIDFQTLVWFETEFSVFQSTQKSTVLMGRRFGCDRSRIGTAHIATPHPRRPLEASLPCRRERRRPAALCARPLRQSGSYRCAMPSRGRSRRRGAPRTPPMSALRLLRASPAAPDSPSGRAPGKSPPSVYVSPSSYFPRPLWGPDSEACQDPILVGGRFGYNSERSGGSTSGFATAALVPIPTFPGGLRCTETSTGSFKAIFSIAFPGNRLSLDIGTVYLRRASPGMTTISLTNDG